MTREKKVEVAHCRNKPRLPIRIPTKTQKQVLQPALLPQFNHLRILSHFPFDVGKKQDLLAVQQLKPWTKSNCYWFKEKQTNGLRSAVSKTALLFFLPLKPFWLSYCVTYRSHNINALWNSIKPSWMENSEYLAAGSSHISQINCFTSLWKLDCSHVYHLSWIKIE